MITASHNPPQFNGLKIKVGYGGSALPSMVDEIVKELNALLDKGQYTVDVPADAAGKVETRDLRPTYFDGLRGMVDMEKIAGRKLQDRRRPHARQRQRVFDRHPARRRSGDRGDTVATGTRSSAASTRNPSRRTWSP